MKIKGFRKDNPESRLPEPGQFGRDVNGNWFGCTPEGFHCNLTRHDVVEHEDGSITVSPSILITRHDGQWHGYLRAGEWEQC